ncbi:MAG: hypothetical protein ONA90_03665 [candidate division KSB1 bacterium]|nr:hypothetical protein [candidate division KSB1 bacterium]
MNIMRVAKHAARVIFQNLAGFSCFFFALLACGVSNEPREVADAFCFRYFIELNQAHALEIASGLAADKLRKEIELLKGGARDFQEGEREFHQLKPFIDYKMIQRTDQSADRVVFLYHLTIEPRQGGKMEREVLVSTIREQGRWSVNNYEDYR